MIKSIKFLIGKILKYNPMMIPIMAVYTILATIQPFIWILIPAKVISLADEGDIHSIVFYVLIGGILSIIAVVILSFLTGNYRMRMNSIRYNLIRDLMIYTLGTPYEGLLDTEVMTNIKLGENAVSNPRRGAGGIILISLSLFGNMFASIGLLGLMATLSPWVMILLFVLVLSSFYFRRKANKYEGETWKEASNQERQYYKTTEIMADSAYGKDIRLYSLIDIMSSYCENIMSNLKVLSKNVINGFIKVEFIEGLLNILRDLVVFAYISYLLLNNQIDISQFFLYTTGTVSLVTILQEMMKQMADIAKESKRLTGYIDLIENQKLVEDEENIEIREKLMKSPLKIEIKKLTFRYPKSEENILDNINLTIYSGEKLALVGENGSGKSTLIKILCKLYKPTSGNIYINGIDINEIPEYVYWDAVGAVFQDAIVFPFSFKENISMEHNIKDANIEKAIEESDLRNIINNLPKGIESTLLRTLDDEGVDVSGGQRQKIYLARAIYKQNKFLMLDEPTAALDPLAEAELYEKYSVLSKDKTSLYISHRLASTKFCDRIAYLKDGKIIELGTHNELMDLEGEYNKIFNIQSKYYKDSDEMEEVIYEN